MAYVADNPDASPEELQRWACPAGLRAAARMQVTRLRCRLEEYAGTLSACREQVGGARAGASRAACRLADSARPAGRTEQLSQLKIWWTSSVADETYELAGGAAEQAMVRCAPRWGRRRGRAA